MITAVSAIGTGNLNPASRWKSTGISTPEPGKWVLIRTAAYQRIARLENGVWRTVDGKTEPRPVISWQAI